MLLGRRDVQFRGQRADSGTHHLGHILSRAPGLVAVQVLGAQVGVALEHLPVAMAGHQRDLLDAQTSLEQPAGGRSEEHTSELQSLLRNSYAVFCLKKTKHTNQITSTLRAHNNTINI